VQDRKSWTTMLLNGVNRLGSSLEAAGISTRILYDKLFYLPLRTLALLHQAFSGAQWKETKFIDGTVTVNLFLVAPM
jgi:hypothetical protein